MISNKNILKPIKEVETKAIEVCKVVVSNDLEIHNYGWHCSLVGRLHSFMYKLTIGEIIKVSIRHICNECVYTVKTKCLLGILDFLKVNDNWWNH